MLTLNLDGQVFTCFFPRNYVSFPGKYAHMFCYKMPEMQKCQKQCNYAHVKKNRSKSRNLSNEHVVVFFRGRRYDLVWTHGYFINLYDSPKRSNRFPLSKKGERGTVRARFFH